MHDPAALDGIDYRLRIARSIWRDMRTTGATNTAKRAQLDTIDLLLDQRLVLTRTRLCEPIP